MSVVAGLCCRVQWRAVARELSGVIRIGAVNCEDDWLLCRRKAVHSYPTLILYPEVPAHSSLHIAGRVLLIAYSVIL